MPSELLPPYEEIRKIISQQLGRPEGEIEKEIYASTGEYDVRFGGKIRSIFELEIIILPIYAKVVVLMEISGVTKKYIR